MEREFYKIVLLPIKVTERDYCWGNGRICCHFDGKEGKPKCDLSIILGHQSLEVDKEGFVHKPETCSSLLEVRKEVD